jgi:hypothetical protein
MAGLRAPEFVCGEVEELMLKLVDSRFKDLLSGSDGTPALEPSEQQILAEDFAKARAHVQLELQTKTDTLKTHTLGLPHGCLGLHSCIRQSRHLPLTLHPVITDARPRGCHRFR